AGFGNVSILARPEGRAPHSIKFEGSPDSTFQSSPGPKAGRHVDICKAVLRLLKFQSSPGPKAGRHVGGQPVLELANGFTPRPARRPGATTRFSCDEPPSQVSILARPEGRAPLGHQDMLARFFKFQSSPGPKAGRHLAAPCWRRTTLACFNPRPARRPGAT